MGGYVPVFVCARAGGVCVCVCLPVYIPAGLSAGSQASDLGR